jgi:hypothetical protein
MPRGDGGSIAKLGRPEVSHRQHSPGAVGSCELSQNEGIVALCAYDQIWKKYRGAKISSPSSLVADADPANPDPINDVQKKWHDFAGKLWRLRARILQPSPNSALRRDRADYLRNTRSQ